MPYEQDRAKGGRPLGPCRGYPAGDENGGGWGSGIRDQFRTLPASPLIAQFNDLARGKPDSRSHRPKISPTICEANEQNLDCLAAETRHQNEDVIRIRRPDEEELGTNAEQGAKVSFCICKAVQF